MELRKKIADALALVDQAAVFGVDIQSSPKAKLTDFKAQQREHLHNSILQAKADLVEMLQNEELIDLAADLKASRTLEELRRGLKGLQEAAPKESAKPELPRAIPADIRADVHADFREMQACFDAGCYRSVAILCGRALETCLFRRYYEATGIDLLEKAPGTGLGNLIAKMAEKGISLDPALANQIHLINQVRVHSVHTKRNAFSPTKNQALAMMLYTTDVIAKLFQ
ncbi:hypothetical protein HY642_04725 [Candidatus Woesearchaeota archaeon]|nr:hypothetical protein [Candidatus Woesearchaeota archaeon]